MIARTNKKDVPAEVYQSVEKLCQDQIVSKLEDPIFHPLYVNILLQSPVLLSRSFQNTEDEAAQRPQYSTLDGHELHLRLNCQEHRQPQLPVLPLLHDRRCHGAPGGPAVHPRHQLVRQKVVICPFTAPLWPHHGCLCLH